MQEFQKEQEALKQISEANKRMERSKLEREKNAKMLDEELDKVPTKQPKKKNRERSLERQSLHFNPEAESTEADYKKSN